MYIYDHNITISAQSNSHIIELLTEWVRWQLVDILVSGLSIIASMLLLIAIIKVHICNLER